MRKRNIRYQFWLNEQESGRFNSRVQRSGLTRENYLRHIINGLVPTDNPPPEYHAMINELHHIGVNLNQITQKAHIMNMVDAGRYDEAVAMLNKAIVNIVNAVMLPRKL
jgi:hypothetical protein